MEKLRIGEEMSAALRFMESGDYLAAAYRCDQASAACLEMGGYKFLGVSKLVRARQDANDNHAAYCLVKDELAEIEDLVADVKPDAESDASGTVAERVRALIDSRLAALDALRDLLRFHPESPETGADLPRELWTPAYRAAVDAAKECLGI